MKEGLPVDLQVQPELALGSDNPSSSPIQNVDLRVKQKAALTNSSFWDLVVNWKLMDLGIFFVLNTLVEDF